MKPMMRTLVLVVFLILQGCATSQPTPRQASFAFDYAGDIYEIVRMNEPTGGDANLLILRDDRRFLLQAVDQNQDGRLDTLLFGGLTLAQANDVYATGIAAAKARGMHKRRAPVQVLITQFNRTYAIQTFLRDDATWFNAFILYEPLLAKEVKLIDQNADGRLDRAEGIEYPLEEAQKLYEQVLAQGVREGSIQEVNDRFKVKPPEERRPG